MTGGSIRYGLPLLIAGAVPIIAESAKRLPPEALAVVSVPFVAGLALLTMGLVHYRRGTT
jgi:hypothetical protein